MAGRRASYSVSPARSPSAAAPRLRLRSTLLPAGVSVRGPNGQRDPANLTRTDAAGGSLLAVSARSVTSDPLRDHVALSRAGLAGGDGPDRGAGRQLVLAAGLAGRPRQ